MLNKTHGAFVTVLLVTHLLAVDTHAQLSPGLQQGGPLQLDPKAQEQQDLKRRLDARPPECLPSRRPPMDMRSNSPTISPPGCSSAGRRDRGTGRSA